MNESFSLRSCDRASWANCEERENQQDATVRCLLSTSVSTCFVHHYAHLQENKGLVAIVGRCVVGCEHCEGFCSNSNLHSAHILKRSAPQQLQTTSSRTRPVHQMQWHCRCSPEDGHNYARNMLRQKLIINFWLLHLAGFLSLHTKFFCFLIVCTCPQLPFMHSDHSLIYEYRRRVRLINSEITPQRQVLHELSFSFGQHKQCLLYWDSHYEISFLPTCIMKSETFTWLISLTRTPLSEFLRT